MPLFRQRKQVFRKKRDVFHVYGQLACPGAKKISAYADLIAEIKQLIKLESFFADGIFLHVYLKLRTILLQVRKPGFAHQANGHDSTGNADVNARSLELLARLAR